MGRCWGCWDGGKGFQASTGEYVNLRRGEEAFGLVCGSGLEGLVPFDGPRGMFLLVDDLVFFLPVLTSQARADLDSIAEFDAASVSFPFRSFIVVGVPRA